MLKLAGNVLSTAFLVLVCRQSFASDPLLQWVERTSEQKSVPVSKSFNPGFLALDETEVRVEFSERFQSEKQSLRIGLKPLSGLANEYKLSRQRRSLFKAKDQDFRQMNRFYAYSELILAWKAQKSAELINKSARVFSWVQANLRPHLKSQSIDNDSTKLVMSLADFMNTKSKLKIRRAQIERIFGPTESGQTPLLQTIGALNLLGVSSIEKKLGRDDVVVEARIESEEKKLKFFQLQQKKKEAYQIVKFISIEREEQKNNGVGYTSQVSFRIPFLSDSEELRGAQADFAVASNNYELSKFKGEKELRQLKADALGLIQRYKILQLLPKSSFSMKKIKNQISSVSDIARSEADFLEAQLDLLETRSLIFENYLLYLAKSHQLGDRDINYLIQSAPST